MASLSQAVRDLVFSLDRDRLNNVAMTNERDPRIYAAHEFAAQFVRRLFYKRRVRIYSPSRSCFAGIAKGRA